MSGHDRPVIAGGDEPGPYLDALERRLVELTERGAHRRPRARLASFAGSARAESSRRRVSLLGIDIFAIAGAGLAAAVIVVLAVTVLRGGVATGAHRPASSSSPQLSSAPVPVLTTPQAPPTSAAFAAAPTRFDPTSFTAIGELTWWLLGAERCGNAVCTSIVHTVDGGRSFTTVRTPPSSHIDQLRFADALDGWAYGPQLWATHDGGLRWTRIDVPGSVTGMAFGDGFAYAVVRGASAGVLLRAPIDTDQWTALDGAGDAYAGLWAHGATVMVQSQSGSSVADRLMISTDEGSSFAVRATPPNASCQFEAQAPVVIWADCATGARSVVRRSVDGGLRFPAAEGSDAAPLPALAGSAVFAAATPSVAVIGDRRLYRTTDGGATYTPISTPAGVTRWRYIGFTDATHGVAIGTFGPSGAQRLYYTTDAGASYHEVRIR